MMFAYQRVTHTSNATIIFLITNNKFNTGNHCEVVGSLYLSHWESHVTHEPITALRILFFRPLWVITNICCPCRKSLTFFAIWTNEVHPTSWRHPRIQQRSLTAWLSCWHIRSSDVSNRMSTTASSSNTAFLIKKF